MRIFRCQFNNPRCKGRACICGKSSTPSPPPAPTAGETARDTYEAMLAYEPKTAQLSYDILTNPQYGLAATTQAYNQARESLYPQETQVKEQLSQNVLGQLQSPQTAEQYMQQRAALSPEEAQLQELLTQQALSGAQSGGALTPDQLAAIESYGGAREAVTPGVTDVQSQLTQTVLQNLLSPTGISPEQQAAMDRTRGQAQDKLTESLRTRANLGGGLFGGRAANTEQEAVSDLLARFSTEDIDRQERARQSAISNALPVMQSLFGIGEGDITRAQNQGQTSMANLQSVLQGIQGATTDAMGAQERQSLNAIQSALPLLQMLFPEVGLTAPQYQSAVPSANTSMQSSIAARGQDIGVQQANAAQSSALMSSLFGSLGLGAGGYLSNPNVFK